MSEEDSHNSKKSASARRALSGLAGHVDNYKHYLKKLKTGASSGISGVFGGANELLPSQGEEDEKPIAIFDETRSILSEDAPSGILHQALEQTINAFHHSSKSDDEPVAVSERYIIGHFLEDDRKLVVYNDMSTDEAPSNATVKAPRALQTPETPVVRVNDPKGDWLWDVVFHNGEIFEVRLSDGTLIIKTDEQNKFVLVPVLLPGQSHREAQAIRSVILDPDSGNVFFQSSVGNQAVALLNNGYRIDQFPGQGDEDDYFITEPVSAGHLVSNKTKVKDLTMDADAGTVSYETADGGMHMTLRYQKLV